MTTHMNAHRVPVAAQAVPPPAPCRAAERITRQIEAIDAWNTARRMRECLLASSCTSRRDREAAERELDGLRRTQQAIAACTAAELARDPGPLLFPTATAVIAHRHAWLAEQVATLLEARGVTVIECTDNGADALGAVVAEQPDVLLAGDRLVMMAGDVLLAETRLFAPTTIRAVQASDPQQSDTWQTRADVVFLRQHPPADIADALSTLCCAPAMEHGRV